MCSSSPHSSIFPRFKRCLFLPSNEHLRMAVTSRFTRLQSSCLINEDFKRFGGDVTGRVLRDVLDMLETNECDAKGLDGFTWCWGLLQRSFHVGEM